jgi:hypothetical protein
LQISLRLFVGTVGVPAKFATLGLRHQTKRTHWDAHLDTVETRLLEVYREVRAAAPGAQVFVVNYPSPLAEEYYAFLPTVDRKEYVFLRDEFIPALNARIADAAAEARVALIDIQDAFASRKICEVPRQRTSSR